MDATDFLKFTLDADRLTILGLVALEPHDADRLAERASLRRRDVLEILAPLTKAGIVEGVDGEYRLVPEALRELAQDLPQPQPPAEAVFFGMTEEEGEVLARFFRGKRLLEIPSTRSKRLVILQRLALEFEPGVYYEETDVNTILGVFHPDYAALRRYLVDESFLARDEGRYWRAGGRAGIDEEPSTGE